MALDRAEALAAALGCLASAGAAEGIELAAGNLLTEVPGGDLHVRSQLPHNWDDQNARRIAGNCARAARPGGWLVVIEYALSPAPEPAATQACRPNMKGYAHLCINACSGNALTSAMCGSVRRPNRRQIGLICTRPTGEITNGAAEQNGGSLRGRSRTVAAASDHNAA